jgi:hypothetical protein
MPELPSVKMTIRAFSEFAQQASEALDSINGLLSLSVPEARLPYQKRGGTFIYCTWSKRTGPHAVTRCTYKTRIIRGGPKKMRRHFAKEHFSEL